MKSLLIFSLSYFYLTTLSFAASNQNLLVKELQSKGACLAKIYSSYPERFISSRDDFEYLYGMNCYRSYMGDRKNTFLCQSQNLSCVSNFNGPVAETTSLLDINDFVAAMDRYINQTGDLAIGTGGELDLSKVQWDLDYSEEKYYITVGHKFDNCVLKIALSDSGTVIGEESGQAWICASF
jgi:hypothetical protein